MKKFLVLCLSVVSCVVTDAFASEDFNINLSTQEFEKIKENSCDFSDRVILASKLIDFNNDVISGNFPNMKLQIYDTTLEIKDNIIADVDDKDNNKAYLLLNRVVGDLQKNRVEFVWYNPLTWIIIGSTHNLIHTKKNNLLDDVRNFRTKHFDAQISQECGNVGRNQILFSMLLVTAMFCAGYVYRDRVSEVARPYVIKFTGFMKEKLKKPEVEADQREGE